MLAYLFVLVAIAVRFMPHPLAFTPVGASLLFFGARGPKRQWWIPLALLAASDVILTRWCTPMPSRGTICDFYVVYAMLWLGLRRACTPSPNSGGVLVGPFRFRYQQLCCVGGVDRYVSQDH
jgi:hypothetical protein